MTTATQQFPSNPALEFAQSILEVTNNGLELIEMLNEIAEGDDEGATTNDRITAASILTERAFGKSPRQISHSAGLNPEPAPATDGDSPKAKKEAESPRLVTQIDDALNQSLGSAPGASHHTKQPAPTTDSLESPDPFDPNSIHFTIQQHILDITNNGKTLRDTLLEIARACPEPVEGACPEPVEGSKGRRITPYHRRRAISILLDRALGTDPNAVRSAVCPGCRQSWTTHTCSPTHPEPKTGKAWSRQVRYVDPEALAKARAKIQRMKDEGILTPYPRGSRPRITVPEIPEDFDVTPYLKEGAAKFEADIKLRLERQKQWPEIEERRRKKLAQIYPSHSEDDKPPDP